MIKVNFFKLIFAVAVIFGTFSLVTAQNGEPPPDGFAPPQRPNLIQQLNLSKDQIQQLRQINLEWNPRKQKAQRDFQEAKRELDEAIYLDEANESLINQRKQAVIATHNEFVNTQTTMQTLIRKVLTNEQLAKFRQLRQEFAQRQGNSGNRPLNPNGRPMNPNNRPVNQKNNPPARPLQKRILRPNQRP